jgi:ribonucleoside-diphosphate reductase alpha chain
VLPYDEHTYKQAPFEDCSPEKFQVLLETLQEVDLTQVVELEDDTNLTGELACAGGSCEIR